MPKRLSRGKRLAITALANGYTRARAADEAGVAESTIYLWLRDPEFTAELGAARDAALQAGITQLTGELETAVTTLSDSMRGEDISPSQIRAANYLLSHAKGFTELVHFGERLEYALREIERLKGIADNESYGIPPNAAPE